MTATRIASPTSPAIAGDFYFINYSGETMLRKTLLITLLIVLLTACAPQATPTAAPVATEIVTTQALATEAPTIAPTAAPTVITLTDGLGREVKLAGPAQKIISFAPSNTEVL